MDLRLKVLLVVFCLVELSLAQSSIQFTSVPTSVVVGQTYTLTWSGGQSDQAGVDTTLLASGDNQAD